ncbi:molybdopterin-synthase adenylyltransferase MoeB [Candidatus Pantoea edessiphila]|uniref:Molybdopterin-synthase adenylyltransferase MoeB n=1 Tax=Candidatus Pantoea edessiphila TaxID=2044610 RepID=A0A2P5T0G3_9GAMM|nr:molybdopterin-synthase adenylyltransferase MoeB [Candidatus Pantoea edessiphila]PPI88077.1 molybdopterin-synthase adenylyltransferase MoeB [Candidatus Pantoea edessiphila]
MSSLNSKKEISRYIEQIKLNKFNFNGQQKIKSGKAAIIGLGGLGCASAIYMVAAGIGEITLIDFDIVVISNLHRQILHHDINVNKPKVYSAAEDLHKINPYCLINVIYDRLSDSTMLEIIKRQKIIIDCTDNIICREQINRLCFNYKIPLVSGAAIRMEGYLSIFNWKPSTPCYRCISRLFDRNNSNCIDQGIMSPIVGIIGAMQSMEAIKLLTNYGTILTEYLLIYDALSLEFNYIRINKDIDCEVCN